MLSEAALAVLVLALTVLTLWVVARLTPGGTAEPARSGTPAEVVEALDEALGVR